MEGQAAGERAAIPNTEAASVPSWWLSWSACPPTRHFVGTFNPFHHIKIFLPCEAGIRKKARKKQGLNTSYVLGSTVA